MIFSETFLVNTLDAEVTIRLEDPLNWTFRLIFRRNVEGMANLGTRREFIRNTIQITYNNWLGTNIQNQTYQRIASTSGNHQLYYTLKTSASEKIQAREITFSIWREITT